MKQYQVALSFSGEQRDYVEKVFLCLRYKYNIECFYDKDRDVKSKALGRKVNGFLSNIFENQTEVAVVFISELYLDGSNDAIMAERRGIKNKLERLEEHDRYLIPVWFEDIDLPEITGKNNIWGLKLYDDFIIPEKLAESINDAIANIADDITAQAKAKVEGIRSPTEWFRNWSEEIAVPKLPPRDALLDNVFIESPLYENVYQRILDGEKKTGITGFVGMGGVGKTYTAKKIAWRLINKENWQVVWVSLLQQGTHEALDALAKSFGLGFVQGLSEEEKKQAIKELFMQAREKFPKLLVVLDNAEKFPNLSLLLDALNDVQVLITTRTKDCVVRVPYQRIEQLEGESALKYINALLEYHSINTTSNDIKALQAICDTLGGHPLGIRLAVGTFKQKGARARAMQDRFARLNDEIRQNIAVLKSESPQNDTLDEKKLHTSIETTFLWTYRELNADEGDIKARAAYALLPILTVLGTSGVAQSACLTAITELLEKKEAEGLHPVFEFLLKPDNLDEAIDELIELSLVEIKNAEQQEYIIHPLIREFAIKQSELEGDNHSLLNASVLFRMAIGILGKSNDIDTLVDLFPRLKDDRQSLEMAIDETLRNHGTRYFDITVDLGQLEELLLTAQAGADEMGLLEQSARIGLELGELQVRRGDKEGYRLLDKSLNNCVKVKDEEDELEKNEIIDWAVEQEPAKGFIWAALFNDYNQVELRNFAEIGKHTLQTYRLLLKEDDPYHLTRLMESIPKYSINNFNDWQLDVRIGKQRLLSNFIIDLRNWMALSVHLSDSIDPIAEADEIFQEFQALSHQQDSQEQSNTQVISKEELINFELTKITLLSEYKQEDEDTLDERITAIKKQASHYGIRHFNIEHEYKQVLAMRCFENKNWQDAKEHFQESKSALQAISNNTRLSQSLLLQFDILILCCRCLIAKADETHKLSNEIETIAEQIQTTLDAGNLAWLLLAKACLHEIQQKNQLRNECAYQVQQQLMITLGYVPHFVRPLLEKWKDWSLVEHRDFDQLLSWRVQNSKLPQRMRSKKDGKIMRLVRPGLQWNKDGNEHWLYPFYIDETPLTMADLQPYAKANDLSMPTASDSELPIKFSDSLYEDYLVWANKRAPLATEIFADYLQYEQDITPENWENHSEMLNGIMNRIRYYLEHQQNNKVEIEQLLHIEEDGNQLEDNNSNDNDIQETNNIFDFPADSPFYSLNQINDIDDFYALGWLEQNDELKLLFYKRVLGAFSETKIDNADKLKLSHLLLTSVSLNLEEKKRVINSAKAGLTEFQCEELIKVFSDEQEKFIVLEQKHPDDITKLIHKSVDEITTLLGYLSPVPLQHYHQYCVKTTRIAHTDKWQRKKSNNYSSYRPKGIADYQPVMRAIIPVFSSSDLSLLEAID